MMRPMMDDWLKIAVDQRWLRPLDQAFVQFLQRQVEHREGGAPARLLLAAALTSWQLGRGHVCLDLALLREHGVLLLGWPDAGPERRDPSCPDVSILREAIDWLLQEPPEQWCIGALLHPDESSPLVRVDNRIYLRRLWDCERFIAAAVSRRLQGVPVPSTAAPGEADSPPAGLSELLDTLFPTTVGSTALDWQRAACAIAIRQRFCIITGGPGTGKTTTVVRLLAALQGMTLARQQPPLRIRLAAPTGKAAARLSSSIALAVDRLPADLAPWVPSQVTTLHRLLGSRPDSRHFRHDRYHPLEADVVVVDEASMVDIEMMQALMDALPEATRLILLGDKDQLASVEAGAVLGDLCRQADRGGYDETTESWLVAAGLPSMPSQWRASPGRPLDQAIVMLRHSHRFAADSGIGQLARLVNQGDSLSSRHCLAAGYPDVGTRQVGEDGGEALAHWLVDAGYRHYLESLRASQPDLDAPRDAFEAWALAGIEAYGDFQVLCGNREGPRGVTDLNHRVQQRLRDLNLISGSGEWYAGRPVLVTRNDYSLGLMNGDIGIALRVPAWLGQATREEAEPGAAVLRVAFPTGDPGKPLRWIVPARLQAVETVFAMTVHKSQGSEFTHTCLVLPERLNPVLTRELVYTGITRAKQRFTLVESHPAVFDEAIQRQVIRSSGLALQWC